MFKLKIVPLEERIVLDAALGDVIYVDVNASGANDGSSWSNAYTNLQSALAEATLTPTDPEQIKIADGTYKPGVLASNSFNVPDKTSLFGGFGGETILSGDIGVIGVNTDNINTIVKMSSATVLMKEITVAHGFNPSTVTFGAGILASLGSHLTLEKMVITNNFSNRSGGGVAVIDIGSTIDIDQSSFTNNSARLAGGALLLTGGATDLTINHSLFDNNSTTNNGGALRTSDVHRINIDHTTFSNNFVAATIPGSTLGGAAYFVMNLGSQPMDLNIDHSLFKNNSISAVPVPGSVAVGAGLTVDTSTTGTVDVAINHTDFKNNIAGNGGGAMLLFNRSGGLDWSASIDHSNFDSNTAGTAGGAILVGRRLAIDSLVPSLSIDHSSFTNNQAPQGGAIHDNGVTELLISKSEFKGNSASSIGGAIYISDVPLFAVSPSESVRTVTLTDNQFSNNSSLNGGAIAFNDPGALNITLTMDGNHLDKNVATNLGGAYYQSGGISWVTDNHFNKNFDMNGDQVVIDLPASVNGYVTPAQIIESLVDLNKQLDDDEISVLP